MNETGAVSGRRWSVPSADGVRIGLLSAGTGTSTLLVHGGMGQIERWAPMWRELTARWDVTAMDRRGRGSSGDGEGYRIESEYADVAAVASALAARAGEAVDVFAHSIGATIALGAAAQGAPVRRLVCYEPPGPATIPTAWFERLHGQLARGQRGPAMAGFLQDVIGLTADQVDELRRTPPGYDVLGIFAHTAEREAAALRAVDIAALARAVACPTTVLVGDRSPSWAAATADELVGNSPAISLRRLPGVGHEAIDLQPSVLLDALADVLG